MRKTCIIQAVCWSAQVSGHLGQSCKPSAFVIQDGDGQCHDGDDSVGDHNDGDHNYDNNGNDNDKPCLKLLNPWQIPNTPKNAKDYHLWSTFTFRKLYIQKFKRLVSCPRMILDSQVPQPTCFWKLVGRTNP